MRTIRLNMTLASLMQETAKWGYTIGENIGDDAAKQRHFVQGPTDPGHSTLIKTAFDDAWAELLQILSAYTHYSDCECGCDDCTCTKTENGDEFFDTEEYADYGVVLYFPNNTIPTLSANIGRLCKRYMLMKARAEWETDTHQDPSLSERTAEMVARRLKVEISQRTNVGKLKRWNYGY